MGKKIKVEGKHLTFDVFFTKPSKPSGESMNVPVSTHAENKPSSQPLPTVIAGETPAPRTNSQFQAPPSPSTSFDEKFTNFLGKTKSTKPIKPKKQEPLVIPQVTNQIIDVSNYHEDPNVTRVKHDGFVFYCRACHKHFKNPIIINQDPNRSEFYDILICPLCGKAKCNTTGNSDLSEDNCCPECGVKFGFYYNEQFTNKTICLNCNRNVLTKLMKQQKEKKKNG
jgi:hypothetical protein